MSQKLYPKKFGEIEVECSWQDGAHHIAKLSNGAYCHITGLPIKDKSELKAVLTGDDLEAALNWFDHRHEAEENPPRRIMFEADGTPLFEDGTEVERPSDLLESLKPGPILDAALMALARKLDAKKEAERLATESKAGKVAKKMVGGKKPGGKKPAGKSASARV